MLNQQRKMGGLFQLLRFSKFFLGWSILFGVASACGTKPEVRSDVELYDVMFAQNRFLAVGTQRIAEPGTYQAFLLTSPDGKNWTPTPSPLAQPPTTQHLLAGHILRGVAFGNGIYVAVGGSYQMWTQSLVLTSQDGQQWNVVSQDLQGHVVDVAFGDGKFVAVTDNYRTWSSNDGVTWTSQHLPFKGNIAGITYGQNTFVVYGGGNTLALSQDSLSWNPHELQKVTQTSVGFANNQFFGSTVQNVCEGGGTCQTYGLLHSAQGKDWEILHPSEQPRLIQSFAFDQGRYVLLDPHQIWTTTQLDNPSTWTSRTQAWREFRSLTFGAGMFVAVGYGEIQWSQDGQTWEVKQYPLDRP